MAIERIIELREKQTKVLTEARAKLDEIKPDTPEARAKEIEAEYDRAMADFDDLGKKIAREEDYLKRAQQLEGIDTSRRPSGDQDPEQRGGPKKDGPDAKDVFKRALQFGVGDLSKEERAVLVPAQVTPEMRAQGTGNGAVGAYTVPQGFLPEIDKALKAWGPMLDPGITRQLNTDSGNLMPWPTMDDTANEGEMIGENVQVGGGNQDGSGDIAFGQKTLSAYLFSSKAIQVPFTLLQDSAFNVETDIINPAFGERIGRGVNRKLTVGTGAGQPMGIVTAASAGITSAAPLAVAADELFDMAHSVDPAYRASPNFRWMFNDQTLKSIRKLKDGYGRYIWEMGDIRGQQAPTLLNHPYSVNQHMADIGANNVPIIIGDFSKYIVRRVREITMLRLVERYADFLQVGFLAFARFDGQLSQPAAVKKYTCHA
ncbi:phage major capsid protein [Bradyrhizobium sp. USDA 4452]